MDKKESKKIIPGSGLLHPSLKDGGPGSGRQPYGVTQQSSHESWKEKAEQRGHTIQTRETMPADPKNGVHAILTHTAIGKGGKVHGISRTQGKAHLGGWLSEKGMSQSQAERMEQPSSRETTHYR